jgi:hypothetical protein
MTQPATPLAFPSLVELQEAHEALLHERDQYGEATAAPPDFWSRVSVFVARAQASGVLLDLSRQRRAGQSILDYWANALYRADQPTPAARLADFDPALAPELPDEPSPYQGLAAFGQEQHAFFFGCATAGDARTDERAQASAGLAGYHGNQPDAHPSTGHSSGDRDRHFLLPTSPMGRDHHRLRPTECRSHSGGDKQAQM